MRPENADFLEKNLRHAWATVRRALALTRGRTEEEQAAAADQGQLVTDLEALGRDSASIPFLSLARRLQLTALESQVVAFALARALDPDLGTLIGELRGAHGNQVTIGLVAALFSPGGLDAKIQCVALLSSASELRRARVLDATLNPDGVFESPLRLTGQCLGLLLETPPDSPYFALETADQPGGRSGPQRAILEVEQRNRVHRVLTSFAAAVERQIEAVSQGMPTALLLFAGPAGSGKTTFARELALEFFGRVVVAEGEAIVRSQQPARLLREALDCALLQEAALIIRGGQALLADGSMATYLLHALRGQRSCVIVTSTERRLHSSLEREWLVVTDFQDPGDVELWEAHIPTEADVDGSVHLPSLVERYRLSPVAIARAAREATAETMTQTGQPLTMEVLERVAGEQLERSLGQLVRTIRPRHTIDALVLADEQLERIREVVAAYQSWHHVMGEWALGRKVTSGKAITCLFSGDPGTGKTFAAEVIASMIDQPLHIVSLPSILSKWVGETERNIHDLFARAQMNSAVLLFDEADSLFGSRVEANTAQDHSRNTMTNSVLQEVDRHSGLVIMTTNFDKNIDPAFRRRILFHVEFTLPSEGERLAIWERLIPPEMPRAPDLGLPILAGQFELSGGSIKNAVLRAAIRAWSEGGRLERSHLLAACEQEYRHTRKLLRRV